MADNPEVEPTFQARANSFFNNSNTEEDTATPPDEVAEVETPESTDEVIDDANKLDESESEDLEESEEELYYQIGDREVPGSEIEAWEKSHTDAKSMQADYTRKTTGVADKVKDETAKQVAEKLGDIEATATALTTHVTALDAMLAETDVNLEELRDEDYEEYQKRKEDIETRKGKLETAKADAQKALDEAHTVRANNELQSLVERKPEWVNDKGATTEQFDKDFKLINDYAKEVGYTEQEIKGLIDHKAILTMLEAAEYRQLKAKTTKKKTVKDTPKLIKPTSKSTTKGEPKSWESVMFDKTG
ncbi:MAG: hypothetical protein V3W52_17295 [Syntrophobacteria bacterium]